jgi:hypothetical protein
LASGHFNAIRGNLDLIDLPRTFDFPISQEAQRKRQRGCRGLGYPSGYALEENEKEKWHEAQRGSPTADSHFHPAPDLSSRGCLLLTFGCDLATKLYPAEMNMF